MFLLCIGTGLTDEKKNLEKNVKHLKSQQDAAVKEKEKLRYKPSAIVLITFCSYWYSRQKISYFVFNSTARKYTFQIVFRVSVFDSFWKVV